MSSALSTLNTTTEVRPLSKEPNPQLLRGCVHGVCVCMCVCSLLTAVCVHLDGLNAEHKFQVWDTILGQTSRPFLSFLKDHVTLKTEVMMRKPQLCMTGIH